MIFAEPQIEHKVDLVSGPDGGVEEVYNFLSYRFAGEEGIQARVYLDEPSIASVLNEGQIATPILNYLRERFAVIQQLGPAGYVMLS